MLFNLAEMCSIINKQVAVKSASFIFHVSFMQRSEVEICSEGVFYLFYTFIVKDFLFKLKFKGVSSKPSGKLIAVPNFVYSVSNFNLLIFKLHKV